MTTDTDPGTPVVLQGKLVTYNNTTTSTPLATTSKWPRFDGRGVAVAYVELGAPPTTPHRLRVRDLATGTVTTATDSSAALTADFKHLEFGPSFGQLTYTKVDLVSSSAAGVCIVPALGGTPTTVVAAGRQSDWSPMGDSLAFSSAQGLGIYYLADAGVSYQPATDGGEAEPQFAAPVILLFEKAKNNPATGFDGEIWALLIGNPVPNRLTTAVAAVGTSADAGTIGSYAAHPEPLPGFPPVLAYTKVNYYVDSTGASALCGAGAEPTYCGSVLGSEILLRGWGPTGPAPTAVSLGGGILPAASEDGSHVAFVRGGDLVVQQLIGGRPDAGATYVHPLRVVTSVGDDSRPRWQPSGAPPMGGPPPGP